MERILVINPGSTSTKIAVFEGEKQIFEENIKHTPEQLAPFEKVAEQFEMRREVVLKCLEEHGFKPKELDAVVSRGGLLTPIHAGAYEVNEDMVWQLINRPQNEHAANVGAMIALDIEKTENIPAYIYDGITVDELSEINKITGLPEMRRKGMGHNLNTRAAAIRYAKEKGVSYRDITVIVAHLGGGISVNLHHKGRIEDHISDEEGPFSPERSGGLPMFDVIKMCFDKGQSYDKMMKKVKRKGGLMAHLNTVDCVEVEKMIAEGDEKAKLVYEAMALNVAKNIAKCAPVVAGKVDAVLITGGIAHSKYITDYITACVNFIAPVIVYPGEDEMTALASGCLRVIRGEEKARIYKREE
ncbi:MAG: butyrate kinase [Eubacteriaceae bacterium]|nr:butyrate kinase [Eubacteriaceae bacterium]